MATQKSADDRSTAWEVRETVFDNFTDNGLADTCSVCLDYRAWMLLRELVLRTPLTSVARLLSAHKLTGTIQSTLQWLAEKCRSIPEDLFWLIEADMSDPNSALEEASPGSLSQPSRKRKRDGQSKATTTWTPKDVRFLYTSICCNLIEMQDIITDGSQGYAVEHLKAALRCPLEIAASTLDCAAIIAGFLVRYRCDRSKMEYDGAWVLPMVQFWQSQLPGLREDLNLSVNVSRNHLFISFTLIDFRSLCSQNTAFRVFYIYFFHTTKTPNLKTKYGQSLLD